MRISRILGATAVAAAVTASLAACSTSSAPAGESSAPAGEAGVFPVEVEHALGTTTIEAKPERVASIGWGNQDVALALGVAPVGADDQTWSMDGTDGLGLYEWTTDAYAELGAEEPVIFDTTAGIDFEAIADTQPDLIIAAYSGPTEEEYATLTEIADTVAYPGVAWYTPWRDSILTNSKALGLEAEGKALVSDLEKQIEDATADADFEGKTAAFLFLNAADLSTTSVYATGDSRAAFLADLGFEVPQAAKDAADAGTFYADISAENVDKLADVDVIVSYGGDELLPALQADPLWSTLPAVKNGSVVTVGAGDDLSGAVSPTALSIPWMLDTYVGLLSDAAAKAE
ncbi:iron-siderophore ABC transporter substrate-binding protein [Microbacterium paludicola]|uniref:Iron-siderophore ABC transporter substrate-binding protein n=1 Tax=Microbacterium paludicola TaxID=300019 RepID=A0A4Y9G098_9MICO|nr:iron-siderophore ABC transporter substrate-binding protein [Microbacterium paludicola]MBF0815116.1 iron-siderophore ABC transporter substrate-binding protein [Microbacterium paludicola]TFU34385.1 iron-siderophore ABC transporter substrate-binding protein [Microbacterium paludicola]